MNVIKYILGILTKINLEGAYYLAGILTFIVILLTLRQMKKQQYDESRPYVILYIYKPDPYDDFAYICLENIGKTGAYNVNIDKETEYYVDNKSTKTWTIKSHYSFLAPGQKIHYAVETATKNEKIEGVIKYQNNKNKRLSNLYCLDFKLYKNTLYTHSNLHKIAESLKTISEKLGK